MYASTSGRSPEPDALNLRPWTTDDLPLIKAILGDPAMTEYLGGPETPEKMQNRQERCVGFASSEDTHMFVIVLGAQRLAAGCAAMTGGSISSPAIPPRKPVGSIR